MATTREVRVIINGEEYVSTAAKKAEGGLSGFVSSAKTMLAGLAAAAVTYALGSFFKTAVEEASKSREAMGQLAIAVENSGASFTAMEPAIESALDKLARVTKFSDDDFASAMQQMTLKTGDAGWALKSLGLAADLAAQAGIPLEQAAQLLAQAHEGNFKALNKLIPELKGAANWEELLAQKTHGAAEAQLRQLGPIDQAKKMFGEFTEEVGKTILGNAQFETAGFSLVDMLAELAQWVKANEGEIGKFTDAIVSATTSVGDGLVPVMRLLKGVGGPILVYIRDSVAEAGFMFQAFAGMATTAVGGVVTSLGLLVEKGGKFLKVFGIEAVEETGTKLKETGQLLVNEGLSNMEASKRHWLEYQARMKDAGDKGVEAVADQERKKTRIVKDELGKQEDEYKTYVANLKAWYKILDGEVVSFRKTLDTLNPAVKKAMETEQVDGMNKMLAEAKAQADAAVAAMKKHGDLPPLVKQTEVSVKEMADTLAQGARTALDVASAFGKIDNDAKAAFTSAINVGDAISKMMTGGVTFGGVTAVIGGVASIVSQMMAGDAERKRLLSQNNDRLRELRDEVGNLDLNITGEDFAKATNALSAAVPNLLGGIGNRGSDIRTLMGALEANGLSLGDLDRIAGELGIVIRDKNGSLNFDLVKQLFQGLKDTEFGTFGQDFASQLRAVTSGFSINGTSDAGQIGGLGALGAQFSPLLRSIFNPNDLAGSRVRLQEAFARMQSGTITAGELGGLTGNQFLDFITDLIGRIDRLAPGVGIGAGGEVTNGGGGTVDIPGVGLVPTSAGDAMVTALKLQTDTLAPLLESGNLNHQRTADATESMRDTLLRIETFLQTFDLVGTVDASMERTRRANALERGIGLTY